MDLCDLRHKAALGRRSKKPAIFHIFGKYGYN